MQRSKSHFISLRWCGRKYYKTCQYKFNFPDNRKRLQSEKNGLPIE